MNIYKIINDVNNYVYIGQTKNELSQRYKEHLKDSKKYKDKNRSLYKAFNEIGIEHFSIHLIEQCEDDLGNEREIYWINKYDSFLNGYNDTLGGTGSYQIDPKIVINEYQDLRSVTKVAQKLEICINSVSRILHSNGIGVAEIRRIDSENRGIKVNQYNKQGEFIQSFVTISDAVRWLVENGMILNTKKCPAKAGCYISDVCKGKGKTAYGYVWRFA